MRQFEADQAGRVPDGALSAAFVRLQQLLVAPPAAQVAQVGGAQVGQLVTRPTVLLAGHLTARDMTSDGHRTQRDIFDSTDATVRNQWLLA